MRNTTSSKKSARRGTKSARKPRRNTPTHAAPVGIDFEVLETRQLMATINVTDYGAKPNDNSNDLGAIQAAINASRPGDTIRFSGGTFDLSDQIVVPGDRTYKGENGAVLRGKGAEGQLVKLQSNNATFTGLTFDGGGIFIEKPGGGFNQNINIDYNVFRLNLSGGSHRSAITFTSGLQNSRISNNYFTGYNGGGFGIYGYNYNGLTIANNELVDITAGMHIDAFVNSGNLLVEQNYMKGLKGMGLEFQSTASNLKFLDNYYEKPNLSSNFNQNNNSFAYSLILDKSSNIQIKRNTVIAPERPDGVGCRIAFEVGGDNTIVEENYVNGVNHVLASNDGVGSSSVTLKNNKFMNYLQYVGGIRPGAITYVGTNNASTNLSWDINRAKPGIGAKRYGSTPAPTPTPTPDPEPTPEPTTAPISPTGLVAMVTGPTSVNLFWTDRAYNESGYRIESSTDGENWSILDKVGADVSTFTATGLTTGKSYQFRVRAYNATGSSGTTNVVTLTPVASDPNKGIYISDLQWKGSTNGWGPSERDRSNGEMKDGDGRVLTIGGRTFAKGIGVHAGSEIRVALDGKYTTFLADAGLDDESNGRGSVVFEVWADGVKLYSSGTVSGQTLKSVAVNVANRKELVLKVTNAGDSNDYDHANWANARLLTQTKQIDDVEPIPFPRPNNKGTLYLSDTSWSSVRNGWGPVELNKSVGEKAANDGKTITLAGKTYSKGLGVHSDSEIRYVLGANFGTFIADIGVDDEVGNKGSVVFQVWADNVLLYDSGKITGADATRTINVNVEGRQELWLLVTNAGDGTNYDHADWADARLTVAPRPADLSTTYLSDLSPEHVSNGWGPVEKDRSVGDKAINDGTPMLLNGRTYARGLGVHSDSKLVYNLNGLYSTFFTDLGIDDSVGSNGSVIFQIYADGAKVWESVKMTGSSPTRMAMVNVAGVDQLWLVVTDANDGNYYDHANWANARLVA